MEDMLEYGFYTAAAFSSVYRGGLAAGLAKNMYDSFDLDESEKEAKFDEIDIEAEDLDITEIYRHSLKHPVEAGWALGEWASQKDYLDW